jgi:hypothetical protein
MEFEARGGPAHTRSLSVRVEEHSAGRWTARGTILDLRKRGLVPMAGDLQTAGVIHHMRVEAEVDTASGTLASIRAEQPSVAFEASPGTGGECCRDPVTRIEALAGASLADGFATRLGGAIGGPRGCSHVLTLAQAVGSAAQLALVADRARFGAPARRAGERVFQRSLAIDGVLSPEGPLELVLQQADVHFAPAPPDAQPLDRLARHLELRVHATVDLDSMTLRRLSAAERSTDSFTDSPWRERSADVAWLAGRPAMGGVARAVLERFGADPADAPLRDALLHLSPTIVQCIPSIAERWRAALGAGTDVSRAPSMMGHGGMTDSCYMWRRDGFLAKRIESELKAFRQPPERS